MSEYLEVMERIATALEKIADKTGSSAVAQGGGSFDSSELKPTKCKKCGASVYWVKTFAGKNMMVNSATYTPGDGIYDKQNKGHVSHFDTCGKQEDEKNEEEVPF